MISTRTGAAARWGVRRRRARHATASRGTPRAPTTPTSFHAALTPTLCLLKAVLERRACRDWCWGVQSHVLVRVCAGCCHLLGGFCYGWS